MCAATRKSISGWFWLLTLSSLIFSTLVRKSSSRLVHASLWLSEVRAKKYATASLHTLHEREEEIWINTPNRTSLEVKYEVKHRKVLLIPVLFSNVL